MKHFTELTDLPVYNLQKDLTTLLNDNIIKYNGHSQICLNTLPGNNTDYLLGIGSLYYNWNNSTVDKDGNIDVPVNKFILNESDFTVLCDQFIDTSFEKVYNALSDKYILGRVRIMNLHPKTCLSWHVDYHPRVHFPIDTHTGCFMVIGDQVKHLEKNKWYFTDTTILHSVFNGSKSVRSHLVATIIGDR
jgi:hypothetical protein